MSSAVCWVAPKVRPFSSNQLHWLHRMKPIFFRTAVSSLLITTFLFATACKDKDDTDTQLAEVKSSANEFMDDLKGYTYAQRKEYAEKLEERLAIMKKKLSDLGEKI